MSHKRVLFGTDARIKVLRGVEAIADAVRVTLGPRSKRVLIERKWGPPLVCDDGVSIAKELELKDPEENLGVRMLRQAAERTGDVVGDGTTTSMLLAHAIFSEGVRNVVAGASAIELKRGIERGSAAAIRRMRELSRPVQSVREKAQVATISAHGNSTMGELVAQAVEKVGDDGAISVEEATSTETTLDVVNGMRFDRGYVSHYFVTDTARMECVLENPLILIHQSRVSGLSDLVPFLELVLKAGRSLLIIAEDIEGEALATIVVNRLRGALQCCAVKAPGFGEQRSAMLQDIAVLTGGEVLAAETGAKLENATLAEAGRAHRVVVNKDSTTIVGGEGRKEALTARVEQLRKQARDSTSQYDKEKLQERIARLLGGVAVIRAGAPTETEVKALKEAFDDAISSTRAAIAEGIVPGAGYALLQAAEAVRQEAEQVSGDERTGLLILHRALQAPTRQIALNSGLDSGVVIERMHNNLGRGLNGATGDYVDLVETGIVDATKVVRIALENAVSVAGILLLTEATLTEPPEPPAALARPPEPLADM